MDVTEPRGTRLNGHAKERHMSMEESRPIKRTVVWVTSVLALVLMPTAGCGGGDDRDGAGKAKPREKAIDGTFVGKVLGTSAFVAVVASPAEAKKEKRSVTVYVSDGKNLSEWLPGSAQHNSFSATSEDRDAEVEGKLGGKGVTGSVKLPDGKTVRFKADRATGAAGLYDLTVSSRGKLEGASAAGIGLKGETALQQGIGSLKLADGRRRKFDVTEAAAGSVTRLQAGQLRLIVLGDGELRGAGMPRSTGGEGDSGFFVRSSS
jgi:hypothetical protein